MESRLNAGIQYVSNEAPNDDLAWRVAGRRQFEAAYAPEDSVYERLIDETPSR
jgi:hypothetical protein